jgi:hypothetical protein
VLQNERKMLDFRGSRGYQEVTSALMRVNIETICSQWITAIVLAGHESQSSH